jgi:hypothetical protein
MLGVNHNVRGNRSATNDDTYAPLTCTWYDNLVRIACIGEGSCFIHSFLKGFFREYQENNSARFRLNTAAMLRRDLAILLMTEDSRYPGHTYWETTGNGAFPRMVMTQIQDESLIQDMGVDYSLAGLQRLFNSDYYLGQEIYEFISEILNIDVYIFLATREDLVHLSNTRRHGVQRNAVVVIGNTYHYEVLAVDTLAGQPETPGQRKTGGFQTLFPPDDPFIQAIIRQFDLTWEEIPFDPDQTFVNNIIDVFTERIRIGATEDDIRLEFSLPPVIQEIFKETDPFRMILTRLVPRIRQELADRGIAIRVTVGTRRERIIQTLQEAGYTQENLDIINQLIQIRIDPDNQQQTMESIIDQLEQENQLHPEMIQVLRMVNEAI